MGCKASKQNQSLLPIDCSFAPTQRADLDEFFVRACQLLQKMETLRYQIYTTKQQGIFIAGIPNIIDSPYNKAVQVFFWALSATKHGHIAHTEVAISRQHPYLKVNLDGLCKETIGLEKALREYLEILNETPQSLQNMVTQLQLIKEEQMQIKKNLDPKMPPKVAKAIEDNMRKLTDGITTSAKVLSQIPDEQVNAWDLINYMESIVGTADEIGAKAAAARLIRPIDIYQMVEQENKRNAKSRGKSVDKKKTDQQQNWNTSAQNVQNEKGTSQINHNVDYSQPQGTVVNPNDIVIQNHGNQVHNNVEQNNLYPVIKVAEGPNQNHYRESLSFGEGKNGISVHSQINHSQTTPVEIISENRLDKHEIEKSKADRQRWLAENQSIEGGMSLNNSHIQSSFVQQAGQDDKLLKKHQTAGQQPKGHFFVRDREFEVVMREEHIEAGRRKSPGGYLSPGGTKQAGILQGEENIIDEQEMVHALANDSVMVRKFIEKAQGYLEMKD